MNYKLLLLPILGVIIVAKHIWLDNKSWPPTDKQMKDLRANYKRK